MDVQHFVADVRNIRTPQGLEQSIAGIAREMGFDNVTMFQHVDLSRIVASYSHMKRGELIGITTAPEAWSEYYRDHNFVRVDPRVLACQRTAAPFRTEEMGRIIRLSAAQREVHDRQRGANIGDCFIVPVHFPGEPTGSFTFSVGCGRELPTKNLAMAHWVASISFDAGRLLLMKIRNNGATSEPPRLTERQLQCTILVGRGLREEEIGRRLGISTETVRRHLKAARQSYGVGKSVQLVTHALRDGQISLHDVFE